MSAAGPITGLLLEINCVAFFYKLSGRLQLVVISTESSLPGITVTHLFTNCWTGIYGTHFIDNNLVNNVNISSVSDNYVLNILQPATNNPFKIGSN